MNPDGGAVPQTFKIASPDDKKSPSEPVAGEPAKVALPKMGENPIPPKAVASSKISSRILGGRVRLTNNDRWFFIQLYRWFPSILNVLTIIRPETLVRWHRAGFRCYWRWKSRPRGGRPLIEADLRALIRRLWQESAKEPQRISTREIQPSAQMGRPQPRTAKERG